MQRSYRCRSFSKQMLQQQLGLRLLLLLTRIRHRICLVDESPAWTDGSEEVSSSSSFTARSTGHIAAGCPRLKPDSRNPSSSPRMRPPGTLLRAALASAVKDSCQIVAKLNTETKVESWARTFLERWSCERQAQFQVVGNYYTLGLRGIGRS